MKFRVRMRQWVEEIAEVEIEAPSSGAAIAKAEQMLADGDIDDWRDGNDSEAEVCAVFHGNHTVWRKS